MPPAPGFRFRRARFRVEAALSTRAEKPRFFALIWPFGAGKARKTLGALLACFSSPFLGSPVMARRAPC